MKIPTSCGDAYSALVKRYGTDDLAELSRFSRISRSTLAYWRSCPKARLRKNGRAHLRRIFGSETGPNHRHRAGGDPNLEALLEMFQEVRDLLVKIEQKFIDRYS